MLHLFKIGEMIQRIQSVYLIIILVVSALVLAVNSISSVFYSNQLLDGSLMEYLVRSFDVATVLIALVALIELLLFRNRSLQQVLGKLNMVLELYLIGAILYVSLNLPGESFDSEKGIWMLYPLVCLVLNAIANKAIKKDEDLVKSVDRIR